MQNGCRFINCVALIVNAMQDNLIPLAAFTVPAGVVRSHLLNKACEEKEVEAKNKLINKFEDVYQKAADRLSFKATHRDGARQKKKFMSQPVRF